MVKPSTVLVAIATALLVTAAAMAQGGDIYELSQEFLYGRFAVSVGEYDLSESPGSGVGSMYRGDYYTLEGGFLVALSQGAGNINTAPRAVNDSFSVPADSTNNVLDVLANDSDPDGNPIGISSIAQFTQGAIAASSGSAHVSYSPGRGFAGIDTFSYTITDGALTSTASVTVMVWRYRTFLPELPKASPLSW